MLIIKYSATKRTSCFNFSKDSNLKLHDIVFVKFLGKEQLGEIVFINNKMEKCNIPFLSTAAIKKASRRELDLKRLIEKRSLTASNLFMKKCLKYNCKLKLIDVKYHLAKNTTTFVIKEFGKESALEKLKEDLRCSLKTKVEIKDIGCRDSARRINGLGQCGRQLCCASFLKKFQFVSIKMVKDQGLPLNPARISGVCGKLLCCIKYEENHYSEHGKIKLKVDPTVLINGCKQKDKDKKNSLPSFY